MSLASLSPSSIMLLVRPPRIRQHSLLLQATEGIFDALFGVGLLLVPMSFAALGVGMLGSPAFGKGFGKGRSARGGWGRSGICSACRSTLTRLSAFSHSSSSIWSWDGSSTLCREPHRSLEDRSEGGRA